MSQIYVPATSSSPSIPTMFNGNTGPGAVPVANILNIVGSGNLTTDATGNTVTISESPSQVATNYTNVAVTPYVVTATDYYLSVNTSAAGVKTIQLPNAPTAFRLFVVKDRTGNAATNNIAITTVGGAVLIDGVTTYTLMQNYEAVDILFNGTSYEIF